MSADPQAVANVVQHTAETVPRAKYETLIAALEDANMKVMEKERLLSLSDRANRKLEMDLADLLDQCASPEEVRTFLTWWIKWAGKNPRRVEVSAGSERGKAYRRLRRRWTDRGIALMLLGMRHHEFRPYRAKADPIYLAQVGKGALQEECLEIGLALRPDLKDDLKARRLRPSKPPANAVQPDAPDDDYVPE